ncbi:MAG: BamA/TamA family outer membrane protein [Vicinamibacterales bacterium]
MALLLAVLATERPAMAQSRAEAIAREQNDRAATARPDQPTKGELFLGQVEEGKWFVGQPRGWYPAFGSIYPGSGLAPGGGYRHHIGYDSYVDVSAMYSLTNYKKVQLAGSTPNHVRGRLDLAGSISWLDATRVPFYGLGNDSDADGRTTFRITRAQMEGSAVLHLVDWLRLRLDGGFDDYAQKSGQGADPSIEEVYSPGEAPLLGSDAQLYLRGEASAAVQWLRSPGYSRTGGLYRFAYEEFNPLQGSGGTFGFMRTELVQHVPVLRETWVVSLRARTESIVRKSDVVPYFLMPYLGSGTTLRGYATGRFRDRHTLLLSGEVRWFPNRLGLDMALFADAGKVAPQRSLLTLEGMKTDYGVGVRFHTPTATALRFDLARGLEGWRMVLTAAPPF